MRAGICVVPLVMAIATHAAAEPRALDSHSTRADVGDEQHTDRETAAVADAPAEAAAEARETSWYGWKLLIADAGFVTLPLVANEPWSWYVGATGYGLTGPVLHAAHRRPLAALGSLGLRGVGMAGAFVASVTSRCPEGEDGFETSCAQPRVALVTVLAATSLIDAFLLGNEVVSDKPRRAPQVAWSVTAAPTDHGAFVAGSVSF